MYTIAIRVSNALASSLNLPNRGVKTRSLIVLNKTVMPEILVECLFADSEDAEVYNAEVIARAIANGLDFADGSCDYSNGEWEKGWNRNGIGWWYCTDPKNKYYYTADNVWRNIDGEWYIFDNRGYALQYAWYYDGSDGFWYYLDESCKMVRVSTDKPLWVWIDGDCYCFNECGRMYCDCVTLDGYQVNKRGAWIK